MGPHKLLRAVHGPLNWQAKRRVPCMCATLLMAYVACQQSTVASAKP